MIARSSLPGWTFLLGATLSFGAAPPVGPDRPLTGEERRILLDKRDRLLTQARQFEDSEQFEMGLPSLEGVLAANLALYGSADWRTANARWALADSRRRARMSEADRQKWKRGVALNAQVDRLFNQGKYPQAVAPAREAIGLLGDVPGKKHPLYANSLNNLGRVYWALGDPARAGPLLEQALALRRELFGPRHPDCTFSLEHLASHYKARGDYARALTLSEQALALTRELLGERHPRYPICLNNLAILYHVLGEHTRARDLLEEALVLTREIHGEKHPDHVATLNNLASVYLDLGEHERARVLFLRVLVLRKEVGGERHPHHALSLHNLAWFYKNAGDYARARQFFEQALALRKETLGDRHPDTIQTLSSLASLYDSMRDYDQAHPLYELTLTLTREVLGEKHPRYSQALNNLATLEVRLGNYPRARLLYEQALAIRKEVFGEKHPYYATCLCNLGMLHVKTGDLARARPLLEQALAIRKETLGEKHSQYAQGLNNLAGLLQEIGEFARARSLYEQALAIFEVSLGQKHPLYALILKNLAQLDAEEGKPARASERLALALQLAHGHAQNTFSALGERQRLQLVAETRDYLDAYLSASRETRLAASTVYEAVLTWKGTVTARQAEENLRRDNPDLATLLAELRAKRAGLAHLASRPPTPAALKSWHQRYRDLEREKEDLEFRLAQKSAAFGRLRSLDGKAVAAALPAGTAFVDLLEYNHQTPDLRRKGKLLKERRLAAFVLRQGKEVVRLDLGPAQPVVEAVLAWRRAMAELAEVDERGARNLRRLVWAPLMPALAGCNTVLVAPDGSLCALPWCALPGAEPGTYLIEEVAIAQLPSAHQLGAPASKPTPSAGLLALGGLSYGKGTAPERNWSALPGTRLEVDRLASLYRKRFPKGRTEHLLVGEEVRKEGLTAALVPGKGEPHWRYVHLATHGYFQRPGRPALARAEARGGEVVLAGEEFEVEFNPLLSSGLVLSGANRDPEGGILTALEVSNLDLRGCELLVLSACESGLGKLEGGEGVLGLQRAFHLAGARSVVASLWSVSDPATSLLMERFYSGLWAEKPLTRLEALRQAQLFVLRHPEKVKERAGELRERIRATRGRADELRGKGKEVDLDLGARPGEARSHPGWWAAFVLSGDVGAIDP